MKTKIPTRIPQVPVLLATALMVTGCAAQAQIQPAARELAQAVSTKLGSARTLRLTATHKLDPALGVGAGHERGSMQITVKRPNRFYAIQPAGAETREIAFDGKSLCLMHPALKHHALVPLRAGSIEQFADRVDERFGFRPPVAELLAEDLASQLFLHVTSARITGVESVGRTRCERLHFVQPGMTGDLWVGIKDKLPRRYLLTFTGVRGNPTWDIQLTKWDLNVPVEERLFSKRPAADSQKVPMLKSR
jgi:hypothetical protein